MTQFIIVQIRGFCKPVVTALESLGCDVAKVVEIFNEELRAAEVKKDRDGIVAKGNKADLKVSISKKGVATIKTSDNRVATVHDSHLMRLKVIDQWAAEGCELFVGMQLTLPESLTTHLGAKRYDNETRAKAREASDASTKAPAGASK